MYAPGGHAYIYLCYGMHNLLNVVTGPADHPEAVLIRGVEGAIGPRRVTKMLQPASGVLQRLTDCQSESCIHWLTNGRGML